MTGQNVLNACALVFVLHFSPCSSGQRTVSCSLLVYSVCVWVCYAHLPQSCPTLCNSTDCSPPGSSVHKIFLARIPDWVVMPSSKGSSWPEPMSPASPALLHPGFFTAETSGKDVCVCVCVFWPFISTKTTQTATIYLGPFYQCRTLSFLCTSAVKLGDSINHGKTSRVLTLGRSGF